MGNRGTKRPPPQNCQVQGVQTPLVKRQKVQSKKKHGESSTVTSTSSLERQSKLKLNSTQV